MILTDFLPTKPGQSWSLAQQVGITHAIAKCAPDLTGLPAPDNIDIIVLDVPTSAKLGLQRVPAGVFVAR